MGKFVAEGSIVDPQVRFLGSGDELIYIGQETEIGANCIFSAGLNVEVGDQVIVEKDVVFVAESEGKTGVILLHDEVRVGSGSKILAGVTIGQGARILPGSVVRQDVPSLAVIAGEEGEVVGRISGDTVEPWPDMILRDTRLPEVVPRVSIIIPVYNQDQYTRLCLHAIAKRTTGDYEVIVIDNASTDGTAQLLEGFQGIASIFCLKNSGYIGACNRGAREARGEYLVFLNNDTIVQEGWLEGLLDVFDDPRIGAAGGKLLNADGTLQEAGCIVWRDGEGWQLGKGADPRDPYFSQVRQVDYCSGAGLMIRRELFSLVGGFDSRYAPGYYEDVDLCFALRDKGYAVVYAPDARIVHFEGGSAGRDTAQGMKRYQVLNREKFKDKWAQALERQYPNDPQQYLDKAAKREGLDAQPLAPRPLDDEGWFYENELTLERSGEPMPDLIREVLGQGCRFFLTGDYLRARQAFMAVRDVQPDEAMVYNNLAWTYLTTGDKVSARQYALMALGLSQEKRFVENARLLELGAPGNVRLSQDDPFLDGRPLPKFDIAPTLPIKRILIIDYLPPMYDQSAGAFRQFQLIRIMLDLGYSVTFLAVRGRGPDTERYVRELQALGVEVLEGDLERLDIFLGRRRGVLDAPVFNLERWLRMRQYDVVWISFYYIAEIYLPLIRQASPQTRILVDSVDVHFLREEREARIKKSQKGLFSSWVTHEREKKVYATADGIITVTQGDRSVLEPEIPNVSIFTIPLVHPEVAAAGLSWSEREGIVFVGSFLHGPNKDGICWFVEEVLPRVRRQLPGILLHVVGKDSEEDEVLNLTHGVVVHGFVEDLASILNQTRVSIAPLRYGAGMKGKVGEALSYGLPVVATSVGAEGMGLVDGEHILIADAAATFAEQVVRLYTDSALWKHLAEQGKALMERQFGVGRVTERLETLLQENHGVKGLTSIIILTLNCLEDTRRCLESLRLNTTMPYELIIVDNGSTDGTRAYLETQEDIVAIFNAENLGFAAGNNQGLRLARGERVLLLNNDTVLPPLWLEHLSAWFNLHPSVGMVGPISNNISGLQKIPAPELNSYTDIAVFSRQINQANAYQGYFVQRLVGFCLLIKREVLEVIGGLDPRFGIGNFEDDDFCVRARLVGFRLVMAADTLVYHRGSATFRELNLDYGMLMRANEQKYLAKYGMERYLPGGLPPREMRPDELYIPY